MKLKEAIKEEWVMVKCVDCGKFIYEISERCCKCRGLHDRKDNIPLKGELEKMISEMSWVAIGKKYNVCDNTVRNWAKRYGLIEKINSSS